MIGMGDRRCKVYSLVDVDSANLPTQIRPFTNIEVNNTSMPVDLVALVDSIPGVESVVYNQIIFVPNQKRELALLDKKKNRHASMPNPSNLIAVEDIKRVQEVIARENKQLVYTHYNLIVTVKPETDIAGMVSTIVLTQQASQNYEQVLEQQEGQSQTMQRK